MPLSRGGIYEIYPFLKVWFVINLIMINDKYDDLNLFYIIIESVIRYCIIIQNDVELFLKSFRADRIHINKVCYSVRDSN